MSVSQLQNIEKIGVILAETALEDLGAIRTKVEENAFGSYKEILSDLQRYFLPYWGLVNILNSEPIFCSAGTMQLRGKIGLGDEIRHISNKMGAEFTDFLDTFGELASQFGGDILPKGDDFRCVLSVQFRVAPIYEYWITNNHNLDLLHFIGSGIKTNLKYKEKFVQFSKEETNGLKPIKFEVGAERLEPKLEASTHTPGSSRDSEHSASVGAQEGVGQAEFLRVFLEQDLKRSEQIERLISTFKDILVSTVNDTRGNVQAGSSQLDLLQFHHIEKFFLSKDSKFDGSPKSALKFCRHMLEVVFPRVSSVLNRVHIMKNSMTEKLGSVIFETFDYSEQACEKVVIEILEQYSNRVEAATDLVDDFLAKNFPFNMNQERNELHIISFIKELRNLLNTLRLYGMSNMVNNFYFYRNFIKQLPANMRLKWLAWVKESDMFRKDIFGLDESTKQLFYKMKGAGGSTSSLASNSYSRVKYPPEEGSSAHEITFDLKDFISWLENYWIKRQAHGAQYYDSFGESSKLQITHRPSSSGHQDEDPHGSSSWGSSCCHDNKVDHYPPICGTECVNDINNQIVEVQDQDIKVIFDFDTDVFVVKNKDRVIIRLVVPKSPRSFRTGKRSLFEIEQFRKLQPMHKLAFLMVNLGCVKCGYNHPTTSCKEREIHDWPCNKCLKSKQKGSDHKRVGHSHNTAVHDEKYFDYRQGGYVKIVKLISKAVKARRNKR